jgi:hypothetical protein
MIFSCIGASKLAIILEGIGGFADILSRKELLEGFRQKPHVAQSAEEALEFTFV